MEEEEIIHVTINLVNRKMERDKYENQIVFLNTRPFLSIQSDLIPLSEIPQEERRSYGTLFRRSKRNPSQYSINETVMNKLRRSSFDRAKYQLGNCYKHQQKSNLLKESPEYRKLEETIKSLTAECNRTEKEATVVAQRTLSERDRARQLLEQCLNDSELLRIKKEEGYRLLDECHTFAFKAIERIQQKS